MRSRPSSSLWLNLILAGVLLVVAALALAAAVGLFAYSRIAAALPPPQELLDRANTFKSTSIYDRDGNLLYEIFPQTGGRRQLVPLGAISLYLINATLATEDPNFYRHPGVDPVGVVRAVYYILRNDPRRPGGSGISQQLVKLTFLTSDKTYDRKIKEAVLAIEITRRYTKDQILEIYLNHIFYGNLAYGAEAAAQTYFGKPASDLTLAEATLIAGIAQYPGLYDPYSDWDAARGRQADVLRLMVEHGFIRPEEATAAWAQWEDVDPNLVLARHDAAFPAPHFVLMVRQQIEATYGAEVVAQGGLRVTTTLDPRLQALAEEAVRQGMADLQQRNADAYNAALVALDPNNGEILAMVGSPDYGDTAHSGAVDMAVVPRQTGSAIKPLTYVAAFEPKDNYWTPATVIQDERTEFPDGPGRPAYVPRNYDGRFHGPVSVRSALANSYNIPAVKALQHAGIPALKDVARRLGITTLNRDDYGLSLTLGGGEVSPLALTAAFAAFANGGNRVEPHAILRVETEAGDLLEDHSHTSTTPAIAPEHAYLITSILSDTEARRPAFGATAGRLELPDRPVAAKTGTTDDRRDGWTIGYTPDLVAGVWVGNADNTPMAAGMSGVSTAAPIWNRFMLRALAGRPVRDFVRPPGVVSTEICVTTGALPDDQCTARRQEYFKADQPPPPPPLSLP